MEFNNAYPFSTNINGCVWTGQLDRGPVLENMFWFTHTQPPTPRPNSTSVTNKISCRNCHSACFIKTTTSFLRLKWFNYIAYSSLVALYNRPSFCHIILLLNSPKTVHHFNLKNPPKLALCPFVNVNNRIKVDTA